VMRCQLSILPRVHHSMSLCKRESIDLLRGGQQIPCEACKRHGETRELSPCPTNGNM
jgi:hypothetical protein